MKLNKQFFKRREGSTHTKILGVWLCCVFLDRDLRCVVQEQADDLQQFNFEIYFFILLGVSFKPISTLM